MAASRWLERLPLPLRRLADLDRLAAVLTDHERSDVFHRGRARTSLRGMQRMMVALGQPLRGIPVVHVAGSKGKGTVCLILEALLRRQGLVTGTYLSPHLERWNERLRVSGKPLATTPFLGRLEEVLRIAARRGLPAPTVFETLTAAAFREFGSRPVDVAVVETGIGGRRDATNVVRPSCCILTTIEREHVAILGRTLCEIAREKAGILKRGTPAVSGIRRHTEAARVIRAAARDRGVELLEWGSGISVRRRGGELLLRIEGGPAVTLPVLDTGPFASRNAVLAVTALHLLSRRHPEWRLRCDPARIVPALRDLALPGRCERLQEDPPVYRDGAHTPLSLAGVCRWVKRREGRAAVLVLGLQRDKPLGRCIAAIRDHVRAVVATVVPGNRAQSAQSIAEAARLAGVRATARPDLARALETARQWAGPQGPVLVAGSYWLAGQLQESTLAVEAVRWRS